MDPGWTLLLLLLASIAVSPPGLAVATGTREKLCGHHFLRALVRACGGPRWAPESGHGHRDLWLEGRPPLGQVAEDGHLALGPGPQPGPQSPHGHRHRRAAVANPAHGCCLVGCTQSDLLGLCPH
ncbi:insulin-like 3 isoform X2 [Castor canadensis]|uniref:Insulin-like 3 isoform X2 n=2 Tax=Castor canadensis TaxID=51338 RepID=A0AC58KXI5_CASCN|nr:insulin-like 3 [Castor canadensis]